MDFISLCVGGRIKITESAGCDGINSKWGLENREIFLGEINMKLMVGMGKGVKVIILEMA